MSLKISELHQIQKEQLEQIASQQVEKSQNKDNTIEIGNQVDIQVFMEKDQQRLDEDGLFFYNQVDEGDS
ncbi:unnamed protein product [Paramecium primaurelia]|uniref:Uncharacterized protein n=1 Tax=Paramecium primaurelia TaxID=5886 RepID=A0A8S1LYK9_PARPR|nr:unnamed protein product [Paramecium primaurelia]